MARRVFFSFHYERDVWRASQVRNCWVTKDRDAAGFWDAASWEAVQKKGDDAVKGWINRQLDGTSVTAVLVGSQTANREYVLYEIQRSHEEGKGLLGIYIHNMQDQNKLTTAKGANPFDRVYFDDGGGRTYLSSLYPTYDWVSGDGYKNFVYWVEWAAKKAGR